MATNFYGKSCTPNLGGIQDFYTKVEVNQLLGAKANTSTTYTRAYIDGELATLSSGIASLDADKINETQLNTALTTLQGTIESGVASTYATLANTYTKGEVDSLVAAIDLNPADYIRSTPLDTATNTIDPGSSGAIALTVRGSSTNAIVTRWLDSSSNVIGYISNSGSTTLNGSLSVGQTTSLGEAAVDANNRRITGVASPVLGSDAVPYSTLQTHILDFYQGGTGVTITDGVVAIGQSVATTDSVTFNNATLTGLIKIGAAEPTTSQEVGWNTDKGTLDIGLLNGVISPYGQDIITACRNNTAFTISKGMAVMFTGTIGNSGKLTVEPMVSDGTYPGHLFFGVAAQNIAAGADGYVRSFGEIKGVNTVVDEGGGVVWGEGDVLWCDPANPGGFTKVEPSAPNLKLPVAAVISVGDNGIIFVRTVLL